MTAIEHIKDGMANLAQPIPHGANLCFLAAIAELEKPKPTSDAVKILCKRYGTSLAKIAIDLEAENERLKEKLIEVNRELVVQNCTTRDGTLDSMAISTNATAMRFLAEQGLIKIDREFGRRVLGKWTEEIQDD